jgi:putative FmdB family regulatory protein
MPLYEYRCSKCGSVSEHLLRSSADTPKACPKCGGHGLEKQFSSFSASAGSSPEMPSCASGGCDPGGCASGSCPFSQN